MEAGIIVFTFEAPERPAGRTDSGAEQLDEAMTLMRFDHIEAFRVEPTGPYGPGG